MLSYQSSNFFTTNHKKTPLQVHHSGKRLSGKRACLKASLTVEAALGLPLIIFSMVALMMPLRIMNADRQMQQVCETVAADLSKYSFTINEIKKNKTNKVDDTATDIINITSGPALGAYAAARAKEEIEDDGLNIVNFLGSKIDKETDVITVKLEYSYKLPFSVLGLGSLTQEVVASRRAWVGADGSFDADEEASEDDEWVYIGKNPTRYHLSANCHYISNDWSTAVVGANGKAEGRSACDRCGKSAVPGQTVYITPSGGKYHTSTSCSSMKAYPQMVRKSTVEHLGCCSYCGGGKNAS